MLTAELVQWGAEGIDFLGASLAWLGAYVLVWPTPLQKGVQGSSRYLRELARQGRAQSLQLTPKSAKATNDYTEVHRVGEPVSQNIIANNLLQRGILIALIIALVLYIFGFVDTARDGNEGRRLERLKQREELMTQFASAIPRGAFETNKLVRIKHRLIGLRNNVPGYSAASIDAVDAEFDAQHKQWAEQPHFASLVVLADARFVAPYRTQTASGFVIREGHELVARLDMQLKLLSDLCHLLIEIDAGTLTLDDGKTDKMLFLTNYYKNCFVWHDSYFQKLVDDTSGVQWIYAKDLQSKLDSLSKEPCRICTLILDERREALRAIVDQRDSAISDAARTELEDEVEKARTQLREFLSGARASPESSDHALLSAEPAIGPVVECDGLECRLHWASTLRESCYQAIELLNPQIVETMGQMIASPEPGNTWAERNIFRHFTRLIGAD